MENEEQRKVIAEFLINHITPENVAEIHLKRFNLYLYENSDEVEINGKIYTNSVNDKIKKACLLFPNEQGEPNIKTAKACGTMSGFPISELDFIDIQLTILKELNFTDFVQRKKYETYLNFIQNKKTKSQPNLKFTNTLQQQNIKNQLQKEINDFSFFQIVIVGSLEVDGKNYENVKQRNNDSVITTENWNERKLEFFNQRMGNYEDSFSLNEKIGIEIENLNKEEFEKNDYKILKKRYLDLLNCELNNEPQTQENEIEHPFSMKENFELFKYLVKWFKPENKAKYTYIFDFIKEKIEITLNVELYFNYIAKIKPELGLKTLRPQPTATNENKRELVKTLYQDYLKQTTK